MLHIYARVLLFHQGNVGLVKCVRSKTKRITHSKTHQTNFTTYLR